MKNKLIKKGDIMVILAVLLCGAALFLCFHLFNSTGSYVKIERDGEVIQELPLDEDTVYNIETGGKITNVVQIKDGFADVIDADCPDKICVNHKRINKSGESIVCLPNKVVVTVESGSSPVEIDGVAG